MSTDNAVEEIKSRIDIVELVSDYLPLKRSGQNYKAPCPFHPEKTPSFMVSRPKQIFHCFGCGAGGDIFGFVMRHEGLTFPEALEQLAKRAGVELKPRTPGERGVKETIKAVNLEAQAYFENALSKSKAAKDYIAKRGLTQDTVKQFRLGYAPDDWHALSEVLKRKGIKDQVLQKAGLTAAGQKGQYDIFRGRVMFPILDMHGDVIAFGGRVMGKGEPKYLNSPDTPVFHKRGTLYALYQAKDAMREADEAVVTEGYMDAIACHQHGITNVVAPLGTALTEEHIKLIQRYAASVVLVFDGDQAGVSAARRSLELILAQGTGVRVMLLPEGEDPDSILKANGAESFKEMLKAALSPVDFLLRVTEGSMEKKINEAIAAISRVEDAIKRGEYIRELVGRTGRNEADIREKLASLTGKGSRRPEPKAKPAPAARRQKHYSSETLLLSAAITAPKKIKYILDGIRPADVKDPLVKGILEKLEASGADSVQELQETTEEEKTLISRLNMEPGFDEEEVDKVVADCIRTIERLAIDEKIKAARIAGDHELQYRLTLERKRLLQEAG